MTPRVPYHVGLVVPDLSEGIVQFGAAFGLSWRHAAEANLPIRTGTGNSTVRLRYAYSVEGPPYLELIECAEGTVWTCNNGGSAGVVHHVGYWSDDLAGDAARLERAGWSRELTDAAEGSECRVLAYHRSPAGPRVEHVAMSMRRLILGT